MLAFSQIILDSLSLCAVELTVFRTMNGAHRRLLVGLLLFFFTNIFLASAVTDPGDIAALRSLFGALGAPSQLTGWRIDGGGDPCGIEPWRGVSCSGPSVISVNIEGLGVGGYLGLELSAFMSLKELDVSHNGIGGEIPYGLPPNATRIDLAANSFVGNIPDLLPSLSHLNYLNASHNRLTGQIGDAFTNAQSLEQLDLSFNNFSGDLPSSFSTLTNLRGLYLSDNHFRGSVTSLADLSLSFLCIENNNFSGSVPKQFESIPHLRTYGNFFQSDEASPLPIASPNAPPPYQKGVALSPQSFSPLPLADPNISSSHSHKRLGKGGMAGIMLGVILVDILVAVAIIFHFHRSSDCLPISIPSVPRNFWRFRTASPSPSLIIQIRLEMLRKISSKRHTSLHLIKQYLVSDILAATNNYSKENLIGEGPVGCVYRAEFPDGQIFAAKRFHKIEHTAYEGTFHEVISIMSCLRHKKVSTLRGYCLGQDEHIIITDYAKNGSLDDFLSSNARTVLPWKARIMIALGVAQALRYLHTRCPPIVHGNIKPTNILLDDDLMPYLADCGVTSLRNLINSQQEVEESVSDTDECKSDIYSFGWVLLLLITGKEASGRAQDPQFLILSATSHLHDMSLLLDMVDPAIRGTVPHESLSEFADVLTRCIQLNPQFRPQMHDITEDLSRLVNRMSTEDAS